MAGNNTNGHIFGDWTYQSPTWRLSKDSELRADDLNDQGLLSERPRSEIVNCLTDDYIMPFNVYDVSADPGHARFWALVGDLKQSKNSLNASTSTSPGTFFWASTHCLPW